MLSNLKFHLIQRAFPDYLEEWPIWSLPCLASVHATLSRTLSASFFTLWTLSIVHICSVPAHLILHIPMMSEQCLGCFAPIHLYEQGLALASICGRLIPSLPGTGAK